MQEIELYICNSGMDSFLQSIFHEIDIQDDNNNILESIGCSKISKDFNNLFVKLDKLHKIPNLEQPINSFGI